MERSFKIAVCQTMAGKEKEQNRKDAEGFLEESKRNNAQLIALPEMFICPYDSTFFKDYAEEIPEGETSVWIMRMAKKLNVYILAGSIPEKSGDRYYNTSIFAGPDGNINGIHRKIHLFDIDLENQKFKESDTFSPGSQVTVVDTELCKIGIAVCYDLRFPELFRLMAQKGALLIIVPALFSMSTGPHHWELLLRARAVDNQMYLVGASQARNHGNFFVSYGNSMIVDPWGNVLSNAGEKKGIIYADIDLELVNKVRRELPVLKHLRNDLYKTSLSGINE